MRSRGIRFPGRDDESLAPVFTPARSVPEADVNASLEQHNVPVQGFLAEDSKEAFNVAKNSIDLLSTVLSSSPQQDVLQVSTTFISVTLVH